MPAHMLGKNLETLKNMNSTTAKFAKCSVRVLDPKIIEYSFTARGEKVAATKFTCVLVSNAPEQYMLGGVPFNFKDRNAAIDASNKFKADSMWELQTPSFDMSMNLVITRIVGGKKAVFLKVSCLGGS